MFAQILRDLDAGRLLIRIRTQFRLHQELQPRYKICAAHAGRVHAIFLRKAPKFRKFCKTFAGFWNKICVISTPRACSFGSERTIDSTESFRDAIRFAQRTLAEKKSNSVRVARRKSEKNLQFFHESFAQIVRDLDAGRLFIRIRTQFQLHQELQPRHKIFVAHAGRVHTFFLLKARRNSGFFAKRSQDFDHFGTKFASSRRRAPALSGLNA